MTNRVPKLNTDPIRDKAFEEIKKGIVEGRYHPGDRLIETEIANELNISRSPVREAFRRLESHGLLICQSRRGVFVKKFSNAEIIELFEIRRTLDTLALSKSITNCKESDIKYLFALIDQQQEMYLDGNADGFVQLNQTFHDYTLALSNMPRLIQIRQDLYDAISFFININLRGSNRQDQSLKEHRMIVEALGSGNKEQLLQSVNIHSDNSLGQCLALYSSFFVTEPEE